MGKAFNVTPLVMLFTVGFLGILYKLGKFHFIPGVLRIFSYHELVLPLSVFSVSLK